MNLFLTSSPYLYQHDPATLNPANEFVARLKAVLPHRPKTLFIASDPANHDMTMAFIHATKDAFGRAGVPLGRCTALDWRNARWAYRLVAESQFIILVGGHVPTQNAFFQKIHLRRLMKKFDGVVMGISAGSMNSAGTVYAQPEEAGESSPEFPRFLHGLELADINILPHYQQVKDYLLDGKRLYEDITYADSMGHTFYVFPDGTYYYQDEEEQVILGEAWRLSDGVLEKITEEEERFDLN
jgi:dipeptidase E